MALAAAGMALAAAGMALARGGRRTHRYRYKRGSSSHTRLRTGPRAGFTAFPQRSVPVCASVGYGAGAACCACALILTRSDRRAPGARACEPRSRTRSTHVVGGVDHDHLPATVPHARTHARTHSGGRRPRRRVLKPGRLVG